MASTATPLTSRPSGITRDHDLSRLNRDGSITRHHVNPRQIAETEVKLAYGLTDVMMVPILLATDAHAGIARLEVKAADMRSRREAEPEGNAQVTSPTGR